MNSIFARRVTILHKNGYRTDYTHVTECKVYNPLPRMEHEPYLLIKGEVDDVVSGRVNTIDKIPIKNLHMTIIDWYIPVE